MSEPVQEIVRIGDDGTPVIADWSDPQTITEVIEEAAAPKGSRAQQEANHWVAANRAKIEARLEQLELSKARLDAIIGMSDSALVAGVERWYSGAETARFFGRTSSWIYERIANKKFTHTDGTLVEPVLVDGTMRFTLDIIREIALSMYRRGTIKMPELQLVLRRITQAEVGEVVFEDE
jgi:hypothetical protein